MVELRLSPFKPGKDISCNDKEFYYIYKNGVPTDRTLYTTINYSQNGIKGILILNKRKVSEIKPNILQACREYNKHYPKYHMDDDIVVVNGETGKIILDTNKGILSELPFIISDNIFAYKNCLYNNNGNLIKSFEHNIYVDALKDFVIIRDTSGYKLHGCYVFDKFGKLLAEYK